MSKNPRGPIPPPNPPPHDPRKPDPDPNDLLIIELVNVDLQVLSECNEGETVALRLGNNPIIVATPAGVRLGDVKAEDADQVRTRNSPFGIIAEIKLLQSKCFIEVR